MTDFIKSELEVSDCLDGYAIDDNGIMYQKNVLIDTYYDQKYIDTGYSRAACDEMSYLRLGFLLSNLKFLPNSILDVGYGNGSFLKIASKVIPNCYGYDVPPAYPLPKECAATFVDSIYDKKYTVVTFFDSLEHFKDIYEIKNLRTDYVLVSVPWCHYTNKDWFSGWKHRKPNEHLWFFNERNLVKFFDCLSYEMICLSNFEDVIRKPVDNLPNILTGLFKKKGL